MQWLTGTSNHVFLVIGGAEGQRGGGAEGLAATHPAVIAFSLQYAVFSKKQNPKQKTTKQAEVSSRWPQARQLSPGVSGSRPGMWCLVLHRLG